MLREIPQKTRGRYRVSRRFANKLNTSFGKKKLYRTRARSMCGISQVFKRVGYTSFGRGKLRQIQNTRGRRMYGISQVCEQVWISTTLNLGRNHSSRASFFCFFFWFSKPDQAVCFYSMFSRREVLRFVFGALDPSMRGYLEARDFQVRRCPHALFSTLART